MKDVITEVPAPKGPLTPAERVESLMDAFVGAHSRERAADALRNALDNASLKMADHETTWGLWDDAIHDQVSAEGAVLTYVKILMGDGTLERCVELLRTHPGGRI